MKRFFTILFTILIIQHSNAQTLSGTSPITYNSTTSAISIQPASDTQGGYVTNGQQYISGVKIFTSNDIWVNTYFRIGIGGGGLRTNAAIGYGTLSANTTGTNNIAIGYNALVSNTTGANNIAMGYYAMQSAANNTNGNISMGYAVGLTLTGSYNTFIGNGQVAYGTTSGQYNSAVGYGSARYLNTGSFNNFFGRASGTGIVTGSYNTMVGQNTSIGDVSNYVVIADGQGHNRIIVDQNGNTGIGTSVPDAKLTVGGTMHATTVLVDQTVAQPDYVFDRDYDLTSLKDVKTYIDQNHHLPEIPSAAQVTKEGINLGEMNTKLLKKIEELTLYLIEKDKQLEDQAKRLDKLEQQVKSNPTK